MAFNLQTFKTRALTALIFAAVMLVGLLWNQWSFFILFTIIHFGCWWEYLKLIEKICNTRIDIITKCLFIVCGYLLMFVIGLKDIWQDVYLLPFGFVITHKVIFWIAGFICLSVFLFQNRKITINAKWMIFAGLLYISLSIGLMLNLYGDISLYGKDSVLVLNQNFIPLAIISSTWINDTMAYIVGSFLGKTPFSKISPKKTWEGTIGGIILCVLVVAFLYPRIFYRINDWPLSIFLLLLAAIAAIAGTFGDLLESKLKRMAGVKDSGSFMPGHGGFLDRFDSLLLAVPFVWLYIEIFVK